MIGAARARAEREAVPARFVVADAQAYAFEPSSFDAIMSRFGVMFFDDPVRAFENLWRAARPGAQLRLVTWRSPEENPFMTAAERAAAPLMPNLPPRVPDAPGQFGFADARRVHHILERSGWVQIDIRPIDVAYTFPAQELPNYATRFGIVARALPDVDEQTRTRVVEAVLAGFAPYVHRGEVRYDAACWMISARAP
jgi:SAM-dependent methyltransferase